MHGFHHGFSINYHGPQNTSHAKNHRSALTNPEIVSAELLKDIALGRIAGPFQTPPLINFRVSPLGLVPKKEQGQYRLIHDLSFPRGLSINDFISAEDSAVQYETLDRVIEIIIRLGPGALLAKADIEAAFRILPIHPKDYNLLGMSWENQFFYHKVLPMGARSSCKIFETFSSAIQWILQHQMDVEYVAHLLDDFIFVDAPASPKCRIALDKFFALAQDVGIPLKEFKTCFPSTTQTVFGIELDTVAMEARLPTEKLHRLDQALRSMLRRKRVTLKELQCLLGLLNFACTVVMPGRAFLRRLTDLTCGIARPHHHIRLTQESRRDLHAWSVFIRHFNGQTLMSERRWLSGDSLNLFTDAAGSVGFAAVLGNRWLCGKWPPSWSHFCITILELYPITLALCTWSALLSHKCIVLHCDNESVVHILNKQTSKDKTVMCLVRQIVVCCLRHNILIGAVHVPGVHNVLADRLSRFQIMEARRIQPQLRSDPDGIPAGLQPDTILSPSS